MNKFAVVGALALGLALRTDATADVDFGSLETVPTTLTGVHLVKWRTGTPNQEPVPATTLTFSYFQSGTHLPIPSRTNPQDDSANNQGALWSDNALQVDYTIGNAANTAILISAEGGGLVSADGTSVLPMIYKSLPGSALAGASGAQVDGSSRIPDISPVFMPSESTDLETQCPAEGPYASSVHPAWGFCDWATRYMMDPNSARWYEKLASDPQAQAAAFRYATLVDNRGLITDEGGTFTYPVSPGYVLLGVKAGLAQPTIYRTNITVEVRSL